MTVAGESVEGGVEIRGKFIQISEGGVRKSSVGYAKKARSVTT